MLRSFPFPCLLAVLWLAGCGPAAKPPAEKTAAPAAEPMLPGTGLTQARAAALLRPAGGPRPETPPNCEWAVEETAMPADEFLLYRALRCGGKSAHLAFAGGAQTAELSLDSSAMGDMAAKGRKLVTIAGAEPDGRAAILAFARAAIAKPAEAARCQVRPAGIAEWPADALVVDISAAEAAKAPKDEPRSACGPYGLDEDAQIFWRAFQGFIWFFELGQDLAEIDAGTFTVVHKDAQGNWAPTE